MSCARAPWLAGRVSEIMTGAEERDRLLANPRTRWSMLPDGLRRHGRRRKFSQPVAKTVDLRTLFVLSI